MVDDALLQIEVAPDGVATLWLNRPHKKNAINLPLLSQLAASLDRMEADESILAMIFRGRGGTFCAGADLAQPADGTPTAESASGSTFQHKLAALYDRVAKLRQPTIAAVEGYAVAGGFELMLACDFAIARDDARIGDAHIRRALFAGAGPLYRLPRIVGVRRTKELMMTGKLVSGAICADWGLVNLAAPAESFEESIAELCGQLVDKSPFCMALTKQAIGHGLDADPATLMMLRTMIATAIRHSDDAGEGVGTFLANRPPRWIDRGAPYATSPKKWFS